MLTKTITITSAYSLLPEEISAILEAMAIKKTDQLEIKNVVDKSILAGVIIKYDGYYIDLSLQHKLKEIVGSLS